MNRNVPLSLLAAATTLILLSGCQSTPKTHKVTAVDAGSTIQLTTGDLLEVDLDANPATGYSWQTLGINSWVLARFNRPEFQPNGTNGAVGAGGTLTLDFRAVGPGESPLKLGYIRYWETNTEPSKTLDLNVVVK